MLDLGFIFRIKTDLAHSLFNFLFANSSLNICKEFEILKAAVNTDKAR